MTVSDEVLKQIEQSILDDEAYFKNHPNIAVAALPDLVARIKELKEDLDYTKARTGYLKHQAAAATIGHDQLNRMIALFDGAGFKGHHMETQARMAVEELKDLRRAAKARGE